MNVGVPYVVLQAVWCSGRLTPRDKATMTLSCPEVRRWQAEETAARREAVMRVKGDPFFATRHNTENIVTVSKWRGLPPHVLPRGSSITVYIDEPDAGKLAEVCRWMGCAEPRHLFFYTHGKGRGNRRTLTDDMLLACASSAEGVGLGTNELITDASVSRLRSCRYAVIPDTCVTFRSLRELPDLVHVQYAATGPCTDTLKWLKRMHDAGMLSAGVW